MENKFVAFYNENNKDCDGCGACSLQCPSDAIEMEYEFPNSWPVIDAQKCGGCGKCIRICSAHALTLVLKGEVRARIIWRYQRRKIVTNSQRRKERWKEN